MMYDEPQVSPDSARRKAKGYLTLHVGLFLIPGEPQLILEERAAWQMPILLRLRGIGEFATGSFIHVDASSRQVFPLSEEQIEIIQERADAIATDLIQKTSQPI